MRMQSAQTPMGATGSKIGARGTARRYLLASNGGKLTPAKFCRICDTVLYLPGKVGEMSNHPGTWNCIVAGHLHNLSDVCLLELCSRPDVAAVGNEQPFQDSRKQWTQVLNSPNRTGAPCRERTPNKRPMQNLASARADSVGCAAHATNRSHRQRHGRADVR
jgi:hypothetical protein